jgi:hypothetical protein
MTRSARALGVLAPSLISLSTVTRPGDFWSGLTRLMEADHATTQA